MGATARRRWRRAPGSLALLTTLVVLSSFFVIAGAQVASAAQCGQPIEPPEACSLTFRFENPAGSGIYTDRSPRRAAVGETITSVDLDPSGPSVIVEVEDEFGHRDAAYGGQISVALIGSGTLFGHTTVPAVEGAASFTDLSIDTKGKNFQLTATASPSSGFTVGTLDNPLISNTFRIEGDRCAKGETCTDSLPVGTTTLSPAPSQTLMVASLTNGGTGVVALSVGIDGLDPSFTPEDHSDEFRSCSTPTFVDPFFHAPAESTVDEVRATGNGTKVLQLRIGKTWRQMVLDRGIQSYRPCITAPVSFTTWNGSPITETAPDEFTGLAPDCSKTITTFCRAFVKSNKSGDVLEGITFPAGSDLVDPRGH
jgi:hypothetical protein